MGEEYRIRKKKIQINLTENEWQFAKDKADYLCMTISNMVRSF